MELGFQGQTFQICYQNYRSTNQRNYLLQLFMKYLLVLNKAEKITKNIFCEKPLGCL